MDYIVWNPDPVAFCIGSLEIRWYSLLWMLAIVLSYVVGQRLARTNGIEEKIVSSLFIYVFAGIFIGARLGHCLFYDWHYYSQHLLEIIVPFHVMPSGSWRYTGYAGLASHGGVIGLILSVWLFCRNYKVSFLRILDLIALVAPLAASIIRVANLMNSEIIGVATDLPWAFVFTSIDDVPRHPAQLYEAIYYLMIFVGILIFVRYSKTRRKDGFITGIVLTLIFLFRIGIEFIKENQVAFEDHLILDMGQILSIPIVIVGILLVIQSCRSDNKS